MSEPTRSNTSPHGFHLLCPHCRQPIALKDQVLPAQVQCPSCQGSFSPESAPTQDYSEATQAGILPQRPPVPPPELADYEILEVIGHGGMGVVYKARDKRLQRQVAIKMILAGKAADPDQWAHLLQRFRQEAEAVARLKHPNIVQIFTIAESVTGPFFVMELVTGGSLAHIKGVPQDPRIAARVVQTLAQAMHAAHREGVVHRDLKPANILLAAESDQRSVAGKHLSSSLATDHLSLTTIPKIADFGLAKQLDADSSMTAGMAGTPSYMAPEQAQRGKKEIGPAADIHALGAILYELLTGQPPFKGATLLDTLDQVRSQEPVPPTRLQPRTPYDLEVICLKCLQKEPRKRYASAGQLADDLDRFLEGKPILARPVGKLETAWKWARRYPARAALIVLSFLAVFGIFAAVIRDNILSQEYVENLKKENEKTKAAQKDAEIKADLAKIKAKEAKERQEEAERERRQAVEKTIRLTLAGGQKHQGEGDLLTAMLYYAEAAALEEAGSPQALKHQIRLTACLAQAPKLVQLWSHKDGVTHVEFSPDGKLVLSASRDGTARVWDAVTGKPLFDQPLVQNGPIHHAAFSPDGQRVLTGGEDKTARLWNALTGQAIGSGLVHPYPVLQVGFSPLPNGPLLTVAGTRNAIGYMETTSPTYQRIMTGIGPNGVPQFTTIMTNPGGTFRREPHGLALLWNDPAAGKASQKFAHAGWINHVAFRPDGLALATANCSMDKINGVRVWPLDVPQPAKIPILRHLYQVQHVAYSPDGRRIVAAAGRADGNLGEAMVWDLATGEQVGAVMKHQGMVTEAHFSPDGKLVLTASVDGTARLWDANNGAANAEPLRHRDRVSMARFSPDGRRVLTASDDGTARLWDSKTGAPVGTSLIHGNPVTSIAFHPHAPLLVTGCRDGTVRLWDLAGAALGQPMLKTRNVLPPVQVAGFTSHAGGKTVRNVKTLPGRIATSALFSPDGKYVVVSSGAKFVDLLPGGGQAQTLGGFKTTHLCVFDPATGQIQFPPVQHSLPVSASWASPKGQVAVLTSDGDGRFPGKGNVRIEVLEIGGGKVLHHFPVPAGEEVKDLRFLAGGEACLLTIKQDRVWGIKPATKDKKAKLRVHLVHAGKEAMSPLEVDGVVEHACLSDNGQTLAVLIMRTEANKSVAWTTQIWSIQDSPRLLGPEVKHSQPVNQVVLSPDGKRAIAYQAGKSLGFEGLGPAAFGQESHAWLWHVETRRGIALQHKGPIQYAAFAREGALVVTCSQDRTARVWDAANGLPVTPPLEHRAAVHHADVGQDGLIVTAAEDHASLWDLATGEMIGPPMAHHGWVIHASFSPDGKRLATAGCDGTVRLWDLSATGRSPGQWQKLVQLLSGHRISSVHRWDLSIKGGSPWQLQMQAQLQRQAKAQSGQRIDSAQGISPLSPAELAALWKDVRNREADLFKSSPRHVLAWHEDELEVAIKGGNPLALLAHLDPLTVAAPKRIDYWLLRGKCLVQLQRLPQAYESFNMAKKLDPSSLDACYPLTLVSRGLGKNEEARKNAEHLVKHFGDTSLTVLRGATAVARDTIPDLLPLAEHMVGQKTPPPGARSVLGAALLRAGKVEDAIQALTSANKFSWGGEAAWNALFLAVAHRQKGNAAEVANWLQKADDALHPPPSPLGTRTVAIPWTLQLELEFLRKEANGK
jgi:WD40 repeat protein/serine/threonine protein kinase/tetratricopeptide (TPR) repeat protein